MPQLRVNEKRLRRRCKEESETQCVQQVKLAHGVSNPERHELQSLGRRCMELLIWNTSFRCPRVMFLC